MKEWPLPVEHWDKLRCALAGSRSLLLCLLGQILSTDLRPLLEKELRIKLCIYCRLWKAARREAVS